MNDKKKINSGKKRLGLLRNRTFIVVLIISIIICGCLGYAYYYLNFVKHCKCVEVPLPPYYSDYGYYNVNDFLKASNISENDNQVNKIYLTYIIANNTWILPDNIDDVIRFNITNPETGGHVEGNFTPDVSIVNNSLYSDLLIINWNDTLKKGSCYQIYERILTSNKFSSQIEKEVKTNYSYDKSIKINDYDEIQMTIPLFGYSDLLAFPQKDYERCSYQILVTEINCTGSNSQGSVTRMEYILELV